MKKLLAALIAVAVTLFLAACNETAPADIRVDNTASSAISSASNAAVSAEDGAHQLINGIFEASLNGDRSQLNELYNNVLTDDQISGIMQIANNMQSRRGDMVCTELYHANDTYVFSVALENTDPTDSAAFFTTLLRIFNTPKGWRICYITSADDINDQWFDPHLPEGFRLAGESDRYHLDCGSSYAGDDSIWMFINPTDHVVGPVCYVLRFVWENEHGDLEGALWFHNGSESAITLSPITRSIRLNNKTFDITYDISGEVPPFSNQLVYFTVPSEQLPEDLFESNLFTLPTFPPSTF